MSNPTGHRHVVGARTDGTIGHRQRAGAGGAAIEHVDELDPGESEVGDKRVCVASGVAAPERGLDVAPPDAGVTERGPCGDRPLLASADALGAPERVDAGTDDGHPVCVHRPTVAAGSGPVGVNSNANVQIGVPSPAGSASSVNVTGAPIARRSSGPTIRDSTSTSPLRST